MGRIVKTNDDTPGALQWRYEYELKDHMGNVRVIFARSESGTAFPVQQNNFYAFSMRIPGLCYQYMNSKYIGENREIIDELDLDWIYWGLRFLDPQLGRWHSNDPYQQSDSPYVFCENNPVNNVEIDGGHWKSYEQLKNEALMEANMRNARVSAMVNEKLALAEQTASFVDACLALSDANWNSICTEFMYSSFYSLVDQFMVSRTSGRRSGIDRNMKSSGIAEAFSLKSIGKFFTSIFGSKSAGEKYTERAKEVIKNNGVDDNLTKKFQDALTGMLNNFWANNGNNQSNGNSSGANLPSEDGLRLSNNIKNFKIVQGASVDSVNRIITSLQKTKSIDELSTFVNDLVESVDHNLFIVDTSSEDFRVLNSRYKSYSAVVDQYNLLLINMQTTVVGRRKACPDGNGYPTFEEIFRTVPFEKAVHEFTHIIDFWECMYDITDDETIWDQKDERVFALQKEYESDHELAPFWKPSEAHAVGNENFAGSIIPAQAANPRNWYQADDFIFIKTDLWGN